MALSNCGSTLTTTLKGFGMNTNQAIADAATLRSLIQYDGAYFNGAWRRIQNAQIFPGAFEFQGGQGLLTIPRRGALRVLEGDVVAVDPNGWPILISGWSVNGAGSTGWSGAPTGSP